MKNIVKQIEPSIWFRSIVTVVLLVIVPIGFNLSRLDQYSSINSLDFFTFNMSSFIPFLFPLFTVLIFDSHFLMN